jgi:pimeloyl-ACP methyl ester carboxylesterase
VAPLLEPHGEVLARTLPGFGEVPAFADRRHTVPNYADVVEDWISDAGFDRPHVIGCSMGGAIALELGARGVVGSVTAISPACGQARGFEANWANRHVHDLRDGARRLGRLPVEWKRRALESRAVRLTMVSQFAHPMAPSTDYLMQSTASLAAAPGFDDAAESLFRNHGLIDVSAPRLAQVTAPTQILWGSRDALLFPRQGRRVADAVPGAKLRFLRGYAHIPMIDGPEMVANLVLDHARSHEKVAA